MFLTSMVANPLAAGFAHSIAHIDLTWGVWALAGSVPGVLALTIIPWLLYRLHPPQIRDTEAARSLARLELEKMGPLSRNERWLAAILGAVMLGWVTTPWHPVPNTFVALGGLCAMVILEVLSWDTLIEERRAWDAVMWFAPLLMMADELAKSGVVTMLSKSAFGRIEGWPWLLGMTALVAIYLYVHYGFASMTAQTTALYSGFVTAAVATGAPPFVAAMPLAFFTSLNAGLTHYGTGSAPVFFGPGFVSQGLWWRLGFLMSLLNLAIWLGIGCPAMLRVRMDEAVRIARSVRSPWKRSASPLSSKSARLDSPRARRLWHTRAPYETTRSGYLGLNAREASLMAASCLAGSSPSLALAAIRISQALMLRFS